MMITLAGLPAGYGYFTIDSVAGKNIAPDILAHIKTYDPNAMPVIIGTLTIQVKGDVSVQINDRAPVFIAANTSFSFDCRGLSKIVFDTSAVKYNLAFSY